MLSFMKEDNLENLTPQEQSDGHEAPNGVDNQQAFYTVASKSKKTRKSTMALIIVFCLGIGVLVFMIKDAAPAKAQASKTKGDDTQIEQAISRLIGVRTEIFDNLEKIVNKFYEFSDVEQIEVDELVKDPFKLDVVAGDFSGSMDQDTELDHDALLEARRREMQRQLSKKTHGMQLLSIMQTQQGFCCMVDDKILYEGDMIKEFKVAEITADSVKLRWAQQPSEGEEETKQIGPIEMILKLTQ